MFNGFRFRVPRQLGACILFAAAVFAACSADERPAHVEGLAGGGGTPRLVGAACDTGQAQPCSITLSEHAGVLECFHGTQECIDGRWTACGNGEVREQAALAIPAEYSELAISEPEACLNNPCNPFCRWFNELPDAPLDAVDGETTPFDWNSGSLANLPSSAVSTGLHQPCRTAVDCQFNTRCQNPDAGSCAHSVCESGIPLTSSCSECAERVYSVAQAEPDAYGQCFGAEPVPIAENCVHDPCDAGVLLKATCSPLVSGMCSDQAWEYCCTDHWDTSCVARYRELNPDVCQCGPGEVARNGQCLFYNAAELSWQAARDSCRARGLQWRLMSVMDKNENDFIHDTWGPDPDDLAAGAEFWLGLNTWFDNIWFWSAGSHLGQWDADTGSGDMFVNWCGPNGPAGALDCPGGVSEPSTDQEVLCSVMTSAGNWRGENCVSALPSVCKGPPLHSMGSPVSGCASAAEYFEAWNFYGNSTQSVEHTFELVDYVITVVARGDYANGQWPTMDVSVGDTLIGSVSVADSEWQSYTFPYTATNSGSLPIAIAFTGDWSDGTSDRNLYTNSISVQCAGGSGVPSWGSECIGIAETTCDVTCDADEPAIGACRPWLPGETDPNCPDLPDVSLGVPCAGTIPVCNHGQAQAPAGLTVVHYPESEAQFGFPSPDLGSAEMVSCTTQQTIPPGECIALSDNDCVDAGGEPAPLEGTRHIMVNPPAPGASAECSGLDNWAIHSDGVECGPPACFGGSTATTSVRRPVDIVFVIDNSGSMQEEIFEVEQRINQDFAAIIEDSGLDYRVIMVSRYGDLDNPFGSGGGGTSYPICIGSPLGGTDCLDPDNEVPVPGQRFFHYSARVGSNDALCLLLDGFSAPDELGVQDRPGWVVQAPSGFGAWLRPEAFKTFVVISDDNVDCQTSGGLSFDDGPSVAAGQTVATNFDMALRQLSPSQFQSPDGQRNYVWHSIVNLQQNTPPEAPWPPEAPITTQLCSAPGDFVGPGTGYQALSALTGGLRYPSCRASDFDAVFMAIAREVIGVSAASCSFEITGSAIDLDNTTVSYTSGAGEQVVLSEVAATDCALGGWYLDDPLAPTLNLCPSTCAEVQADSEAQLFVETGCEMQYTEVVHTEVYEADCEAGSIIEWKALGYDTTIPDDSSVQFEVRTAHTAEELSDASYKPLNTATAAAPDCYYLEPMACVPEDADCNCVPTDGQPGGVGGGIVLDDKLERTETPLKFLELRMTLVPATNGETAPRVEDWKVAYSCLPGE